MCWDYVRVTVRFPVFVIAVIAHISRVLPAHPFFADDNWALRSICFYLFMFLFLFLFLFLVHDRMVT